MNAYRRRVGMWLVLCGLCSACGGRQHMIDHYGQQTQRFFKQQHVNARAAQGSPSGLDSEEAAIIQASYKDAIGGDTPTRSDASSRVLMLRESDLDHASP